MPSQDRAALLLLSGTLVLVNTACSRVDSLWRPNASTQPNIVSTPTPTPLVSVSLSPTAAPTNSPTLTPQEAYERAMDAAYSAATLAQSAQSVIDWQLVITRWQEAIDLLKSVPSSSSYHKNAQSKIAEYQRNLRVAEQQSARPVSNSESPKAIAISPQTTVQPLSPSPGQTPSTPAPNQNSKANPNNQQVFQAPIKRRLRGTPVVDVTFNGTQTFEMVVDTGASGTVITQAMAKSLGVVPEGEIRANTASAKGVKFSTGKLESIAVGGAVENNVQVAISGPDLEIGLLGQDFYSHYDVSIKQNVVEFHSR